MNSKLSPQELRRYEKQIMLEEVGQDGQLKIRNARVLIVGAGGLGTPVLQNLVASGVGHIGLADIDTVSESNIPRQTLYSDNNIGKLKTVVAKEKLSHQNKHAKINIYNIFVDKEFALKIFPEYDLVIDCTDNIESRYAISEAAAECGIPMVYAAVYKYEAQVSVFNYKGGPLYHHFFPKDPERKIPKASGSGIFGFTPNAAGSIQAAEALKIILGIDSLLSGKMLYMNLLENIYTLIEL